MFDLTFRPSAILAAEDVIWAEDHAQTNRVYAIDPETGEKLATVRVRRPCDLAAGFDRIWVADLDAGSLVWIDPATMEIGGEVSGLHGPCGVQVLDDAIWLAVDDGLARVDPESGTVILVELGDAAFPGSGTPMWAALFDTGELVRIDTASNTATLTVPHPGGANEGPPVAVGFESLWVGDSEANGLYRLDPVTGIVEAVIPATQPTRLLVTADAVWLTSYPRGVVERIDPNTNEVVFRVRLGGNPNGITEGFGSIWVAETGNGVLYRLDPTATGVAP